MPADAAGARASVHARVRGSVAHELLERIDPRRPLAPRPEQVAARLRARGAHAGEREVEELVGLIRGFIGSPLAERMQRARRVRRELPFTFALPSGDRPGVLVEGVIDAHCSEGPNALVIDYKTDRVGAGADLGDLCEQSYATQRLVYALAALRGGAERVEVAHVFLARPEEPVLVSYEAHEAPELEARLRELVSELAAGRHAPSATPGADLCRGCPGRAALCSWPPERTGGPVATG